MLDDRECIICNDVEEYAYSELTLVKCKNCDVFFHKICYGISSHNVSSQGIVILCDPCQYELQIKGKQLNQLSSSKDLKCIICFNSGILKRALVPKKFDLFQNSEFKVNSQNRAIWIHIDCAIYSQHYISVNNWRTMSNIEILRPLVYINDKSCSICNGNMGLLKQCSFSQCLEHFHIHCLLKSPSYKHKNIKIEKNHLLDIYCINHSKNEYQISLEHGQKKSIIKSLREEIKTLETSRNLDNYIKAVLGLNKGELFTFPEFLSSKKDFIGFTLLSIIVSCDIWTLRTTALLSLAGKPLQKDNTPIFTVTKKSNINKWINLSRYIPVSLKYVENLISLSCLISDIIEKKTNQHTRLEISNNILYYITDIKLILDNQTINEWETKYLDYYNILRNKLDRSSLDINQLREIFQDLPLMNKKDGVFNMANHSSNLYLAIKCIFNNIQRLDLELDRVLKSKTLDLDKLRYIKYKIENEIPSNSPINRQKYNKVLIYYTYMEKLLERMIRKFKFGYLRQDLNISKNEEFEKNFRDFFDQIERLKSTKTLIDFILNVEIEEYSKKESETKNNLCQDLENWRSFDFHPNSHIITSFNSKIVTRGVTSKKMRSLVQEINKFQKWEKMVNECFEILKSLERRCFSSNKSLPNKDYSTFREKFQRFINQLDILELKTTFLIKQILSLKRIFIKNKDILTRSKVFNQYECLLEEFNRVSELENLLEREPDPNFNSVLLYFDFVLKSRFCLLPRKFYQTGLISKLEKYLFFEGYITRSLEIRELSFQDVIILNQYLSYKKENAHIHITPESGIFQDFESLLIKLLKKFSENFDLVSKIYLILNYSEEYSDFILSSFQDLSILDPIIKYLIKSKKDFDTPTKGLFNYLMTFNSKLRSQKWDSDCDQSHYGDLEIIKWIYKPFGTKFSFKDYQEYFIDTVKNTDFDKDLCLLQQRDLNTIIEIPFIYKIKLIQRYYILETLSILIDNHFHYIDIQDLVSKIFNTRDLQILVMIWRNLRSLDIDRDTFQDFKSLKLTYSQEKENLKELNKQGLIMNDYLYNLVMGHLIEKILVDFPVKGIVFGSIDDYLVDMECIKKYNIIGQSDTNLLISEINEIKLLEDSLKKIIQKMNSDNFNHKKRLIEDILDQDLNFKTNLNSCDLFQSYNKREWDDIYLHQPISYDEEIIGNRLKLDFQVKRRNNFFLKIHINSLFDQESISIIKSKNPNMGNHFETKESTNNKKNKSIRNLINEYLSIIEDERNEILLILGRSSKYGVHVIGNKENKLIFEIDNLFKNLSQKKEITSILKFLNHLVNDLIHFEIAFIINIARLCKIDLNENFVLKEWFNDTYLKDKTPYKVFISTETILEKDNNAVSFSIYKLIRRISLEYLNLVENWDQKYSEIIENRIEKESSREFYNVLLIYNQNKLLRRIFQGDLDSTAIRSYDLSNREIIHKIKSERIKEEYQKMRDLVGDLMIPFKDHMNKTFVDIVTNGLYDMKSSSKFLIYFPSSLIESLRSKEFENYSGNPLRIFVEEISIIYFSEDISLLLIKINMTYKCESFYVSPELLITLSNEIDLKYGISTRQLFMDSYYFFVKIYKDSLTTENYYYIRESNRAQDLIDFVNSKLKSFETEILTEMGFSISSSKFEKNRIKMNLEAFKICKDGNNLEKIKNKKLIMITDIISLISNIILYRVFLDGLLIEDDNFDKKIHLFRRNYSVLDFDLALKSIVMYLSLRDLVEDSFSKIEKMNSRDEIFAPIEIFKISKELSILTELLNKEEISINIKERPKIHHYLFEKESMLIEDFRTWEIASDSYLFKGDSYNNQSFNSEFCLNTILWVPEYENFNTVSDIIELILFHIKKIKSSKLELSSLEISNLINALETKKSLILELEENSLKILKEIKLDEKENSRFETKSKPFLLIEKVIPPPKVSQKMVYEYISKKLFKLIPNFKLLNQTLNILPYKGFEILNKYFNNSILMDKSLISTLNIIGDLETKCDLETKQDLEGIVSHNFEYLSKIIDLRILINESKLSSETLYRAYLKFFRGIFRYFLVYGTKHRWVDISELQCNNDEKGKKRKEIFVPILEYVVLRKLYVEFLSWYKFDKSVEHSKGAFQNCEFIILESLLSCCNYLMEKVSFSLGNVENEYLINHCILRYLYFQQEREIIDKPKKLNLMIGILDIGEYLVNYFDIIDMELIIKQSFTRIKNPDLDYDKYELGSLSVFSRVDNKLIHHFLRKNKIQVSICGLEDAKYGLISNIYYIKDNKEKIDFRWSIGRISYSLKPIHGVYFLRSYVKQYLEYIFKTFYNKEDQDYIKKKDHSIYLEAFGEEDQLSIENLFRILDKYLKDVMDYSLRLMLKSFKIKSNNDHFSYSNLSKYPSYLEELKNKWMIFGQDKWISELIKVGSHIKMSKGTNKKRIREEKTEEMLDIDKVPILVKNNKSYTGKEKDSQVEELKKRSLDIKSETTNNMEEKTEMVDNVELEKVTTKGTDIIDLERLRTHEGAKSDLKYAWLGWLSFGKNQENVDEDVLEIGIYQISNQFTKKNDNILKELSRCLELRYNGIKYSMEIVEKALGNNSMVVLISSNWSHHLRFCKSQIFNRIFHYNYNCEDYEIFEFEMVDKNTTNKDIFNNNSKNRDSKNKKSEEEVKPIGDVRLWLFPCNLSNENSNRLFFSGNLTRKNSVPLPISKYYLIGMLVSSSEVKQNFGFGSGSGSGSGTNSDPDLDSGSGLRQDPDEEISVMTSLLPNQGQMHKIAQYCHNKSMKSESKMEFLINNDMFSSAGTLLSSLLSINGNSSQLTHSTSLSNNQDNYSNNIYTLRDLAKSIKRKISEG
ncbi:uncharacterized protein cubi_02641 [Cryptosporidium ubiquitum]|uniref:PHD-type domain-containing protein n=1 Tax=Cryptosporidium ubiquitum TaxID=857276 RepID=A0A1J4MKN9_9CRYT|nr:uncharacterized protein cubi_02641 [Cryptosporidium ubiquitum]OII73429.1 hypothetical protein cubi_02641 [Cryptosporidium ubiquitum]